MFGRVWFNRTFRTYINSFGALFSNIVIGQYNSNGIIEKKIPVPIIYSGKEQWYSDLSEKLKQPAAKVLPAMSFVQTGLVRKDDRRTAQKSEKVLLENGIYCVENPQDWEMNMKLSIMSGSQIEMDQILEQIMAYFDPSLTVKIILLPDTINYVHECAIHLVSMREAENNWQGESTRRRILWELEFRFIAKHFGPVYINKGGNITNLPFDYIETPKSLGEKANKVLVDIHEGGETGEVYTYKELMSIARAKRITVELENGEIISTVEDFYDGKVRNVVPSPFDIKAPSSSVSPSISQSPSISPSSSTSSSSSHSTSPSSSTSSSASSSPSPSEAP